MKHFLVAALAAAQLVAVAAVAAGSVPHGLAVKHAHHSRRALRHVTRQHQQHQQHQAKTRQAANASQAHKAVPIGNFSVTSPNGTLVWMHPNSVGYPAPPPPRPCSWTHDENGVISPAVCKENTTNGSSGCSLLANKSWEAYNCTKPTIVQCTPPDLGDDAELYTAEIHVSEAKESAEDPLDSEEEDEDLSDHGTRATISCSDDAGPIEKGQPNGTWGTEWYNGIKSVDVYCNNGTFTKQNPKLKCASLTALGLLKDMEHYLRVTESAFNVANGMSFKWIDTVAANRRATLRQAHADAHDMLVKAQDLDIAKVEQLEWVINAMKDNYINARGEPFSESTCQDLQAAFSNAKVPGRPDAMPGFKCKYTQQRANTGYDQTLTTYHQQATVTTFYRDGCMCESQWTGGCPFQLVNKKTYQEFGFAGVEKRITSLQAGALNNALCWYWSDHAHPEWGYIRR